MQVFLSANRRHPERFLPDLSVSITQRHAIASWRAIQDSGHQHKSSDGLCFELDFNSVKGDDTVDDLRQLILALQSPPAFRSRHRRLKTMSAPCPATARLSCDRAVPHCREHAFDRVRRAQMRPMLGGKVEKRAQRIAVVEKAINRLLVILARIFPRM